jgi:hypothetical protein
MPTEKGREGKEIPEREERLPERTSRRIPVPVSGQKDLGVSPIKDGTRLAAVYDVEF